MVAARAVPCLPGCGLCHTGLALQELRVLSLKELLALQLVAVAVALLLYFYS